MDNLIIKFIRGNHRAIEIGKLITIALFALLSLFVSIYFLYFSPYSGFRFVYVFIPHLYLIPIILLALWYPKSGVRLVFLILFSLFGFWGFADILGYKFPPLFVILYTGIDLAVFVAFLLYVKDRRLVEAVIIDMLSRSEREKTDVNHRSDDFDTIIKALGSLDEEKREEAIAALSGLRDGRIIFPLITALRDPSPYIRRSAVEALGRANSPKAVKPLIASLSDEDRYVRESASKALGLLGSIALPELIKQLSDPDWRVRVGILIALRLLPHPHEVDHIIRMLSDESPYVRREAVKTLGRVGDGSVIPYIIEASNDSDPGVRLRAVRAISRLGTKDEAIPVLKKCMRDPDGAVRLRAGEEYQRKANPICETTIST